MKKSLMMRGMVLMHYGITVLLFVSCWWLFYRHIAAGAVFGAVNISVYAFYAVSLLMLSRIYSAYRVGLLHVGDLFYGQVLSNLKMCIRDRHTGRHPPHLAILRDRRPGGRGAPARRGR